MSVARGGVALLVIASACCHRAAVGAEVQWSQVKVYRTGSVSMPPGWSALVTNGPRFDLYAPDPGLAVYVLLVSSEDASAALRVAKGIGGPEELRLVDRADGSRYGEVSVSADRVFAACAVDGKAGAPVTVLAVVRLVNVLSVERRSYEAAGGGDMLCKIAASVRVPARD